MAQTAYGPVRVKGPSGLGDEYRGVAGGSGTSTTVTLPANVSILGVMVSGATSATSPFCATISGSAFTVTTASNDLFAYSAHVKNI